MAFSSHLTVELFYLDDDNLNSLQDTISLLKGLKAQHVFRIFFGLYRFVCCMKLIKPLDHNGHT